MKLSHVTRGVAAAMMLGGLSIATTVNAQDEGSDELQSELGVGLYLGNCDNLVSGAALYDLGDAELETEDFSNSDENTDDSSSEEDETDLEDELEDESSGDETDPTGDSGDTSDQEVVVQGDAPAVWVSQDSGFEANLVDIVDAPFAIAIRTSADDSADDTDDSDFVSCGEFGGAVAGDEIVIPLVERENSGYYGIAILSTGDEEGQSTGSIYLFNGDLSVDESGESGGSESEDSESESTPTS